VLSLMLMGVVVIVFVLLLLFLLGFRLAKFLFLELLGQVLNVVRA
jgi:hypothetical protein